MIKANDPKLTSWVKVDKNSDFPIQYIPFGVFNTKEDSTPRVCSAIGDFVIDLHNLMNIGAFKGINLPENIFANSFINDFMALGKTITREVRNRISDILETGNEFASLSQQFLVASDDANLLLPVKIGDYTDFYSSIEHATNLGIMFRGPENALMPNWRHLPVGYHGRASSIVVSGTDIKRPKGQMLPKDSDQPVFGPCNLLDFELEMGFVIGKATQLGDSVSTADADDYIFGLALFNDWSARDIQKWEYVPLGPFLGKNFASTIAPWIVTLDALQPFKLKGPKQEPEVLSYLQYEGEKNYDVKLEVILETPTGAQKTLSNSNFKFMYWNMNQQLAHHTVNGCNINVGDLYASGTISGKDETSYGSMLELSKAGKIATEMPDGTTRKFILDGDTIIMKGYCKNNGVRIGFGEAVGKILPAD